MQTTGVFHQLNSGMTGRKPFVKPASVGNPVGDLNRDERQTSVAPPKKRRQLTAAPPQTAANPYAKLQALVGAALKPRQGY